jgi:hypothetical protein
MDLNKPRTFCRGSKPTNSATRQGSPFSNILLVPYQTF